MPLNNELFIPLNYFQEYFVDKTTGLPLAGGVVYFWQDINRNNPKPVYEISGSPPNYTYTALPNPVTLTNVGTFADSSGNDVTAYAYPYDAVGNPDNYYVQVFAVPSVPPYPPVGVPQFTRENMPGVTSIIGPGAIGPQSDDNLLTNSQFSQVLFNPEVGLTIPYMAGNSTTQIAPGWFIYIAATGAGNVNITRTSIAGSANFATNPPYTITINPFGGPGITSLILLQRLQFNPNIFAGGFLNAGLALGPSSSQVTVYYAPQGIAFPTPIATLSNILGVPAYVNATIPTAIPAGANAHTADTGYIDIQYSLTTNAVTTLSSAQLIFLGANPEGLVNLPYNQVPVIDQMSGNSFFYDPLYAYKPIPNYLVGWDFPLNPAQFGVVTGPFATGVNTANYVMDQTMVYQTISNSFTTARAANGGLQLTCNIGGQVALIQYLDQTVARKILSDRASVHMSLYGSVGSGNAFGNVTLWATTDANLPTLPTSFVSTLDANGVPATLSSVNWVQVPNLYQNTKFTIPAGDITNPESLDINLNGWDMQGAVPTNTATYFAIVVGFSPWAAADTLNINSVALCPGDIATRPAPKTQGETLFDCQPYYYKTFDPATVPVRAAGQHTGEYSYITTLAGAQTIYCPSLFFPTPMRVVPQIVFYNPVTATATVRDETVNADCSAPAGPLVTVKDMFFSCTGAVGTVVGGVLGVHLTADARFGVV